MSVLSLNASQQRL